MNDEQSADEIAEQQASTPLALQARTLPEGYAKESAAEMSFDPRLAYELALGLDGAEQIFEKYGYDHTQAGRLIKFAPFAATIKKYKEEIQASGISFKLKAKIQAEDLLTHSYAMATDPMVPPAVRADLIQWTAKMAELEPVRDKGTTGQGSNQSFQLNITFAGQPTVAVNAVPVIEGEVVR